MERTTSPVRGLEALVILILPGSAQRGSYAKGNAALGGRTRFQYDRLTQEPLGERKGNSIWQFRRMFLGLLWGVSNIHKEDKVVKCLPYILYQLQPLSTQAIGDF